MADLKVTLFGKFNIEIEGLKVAGMEARKVQELLSYLLLFKDHPQPRDYLCETFWSDQSTANSRKHLRQTLWKLQSAMQGAGNPSGMALRNDSDWIQIQLAGDFWLDVDEIEKVFNLVKGKKASELSQRDFSQLEYAADVYKGDLLEGWYSDWCFFERERYQTMHLLLLDKLIQFCELHEKYDAGLFYGMDILRHDHSYERAHRQLMRLYFLTGNRTQALHQYKRCEMALRDELGVEPSEATKQLYEQIRLDTFHYQPLAEEKTFIQTKAKTAAAISETLEQLEEVSQALSRLGYQAQDGINPLAYEASR
jgi:DNA-binding SARP family transcriptional activator